MAFKCVMTSSVKGGLGKSLVATNLAYELKDAGLRVGILDADVDSPYLVEIAGVKGQIGLDEDRRMVPVIHDGMPVMSFGLWAPSLTQGTSMVGAMHERWIMDALTHTAWGDIDILVVDCPAGLGDEWLTVAHIRPEQRLGLLVVGASNNVSGLRRVYDAASYHHLRILGVVENFGGDVFGTGGVGSFCQEKGLRFLGTIPLDPRIRLAHEAHQPRIPQDLRQPILNAVRVVKEACPQVVAS